MGNQDETKEKVPEFEVVYYLAAIMTVALPILSFVISQSGMYQKYEASDGSIDFDYIGLFIPYCLSFWLIIIGISFLRTSKLAISICFFYIIVHAIVIYWLVVNLMENFSQFVFWCLAVLTFGLSGYFYPY